MTAFLDRSITSHIGWKNKLAAAIEGTAPIPDERTVGADNQCDLGKWVYGEGATHQALAEFKALRDKHAQFHRAAAGVVRLIRAGDKVKATDALDSKSEYGKASADVIQALKTLKEKLPK